uniref:Uncharacterized protein n=1 Tax=Meloidogyne enterolobii TaxID=390850 RepID=A0A6V7UNZ0_MELEN|nr:unnamed protein product [Meloidogyne enterolobii]
MRLEGNSLCARLIPFQHLYWAFALPLLRLSWLLQTLQFVFSMQSSFYNIYRERALIEQLTVIAHWTLVLDQYYFLPSYQVRLEYFLISQLFAGFLLSHVVSYNHYSTDKFPHNDPILSNYACLQLYTTRNMRPGLVIDCIVYMFMLWKNCGWEMELNHQGMSPDRSTTDCATIQPIAGLFIFIYVLSASADTTLLPPCKIKRPRLLLVFNNYHLFRFLGEHTQKPICGIFFSHLFSLLSLRIIGVLRFYLAAHTESTL